MLGRVLAWLWSWFRSSDGMDSRPDEPEAPRVEMMQPLEDREFL